MPKKGRAARDTSELDGALNGYVDTSVRVRYAETDQMGVAYYANHFIWFELGRTDYIRRSGTTYREIEEQGGCYITVAEARCRYHAPVRYDDVLTIRTRLKSIRRRVIHFTYEVLAEDGTKVASGETIHVVTDSEGKPRTLPEHYHEALLEGRSKVQR
ncbi:MAG: acyl-CoA thioesterase [Terriglobia bacterium]